MANANQWPQVQLSSICAAIIDCVNKTAPTTPEITPFKMIRTTNVRDGWVRLDEVRYVTEEVYNTWTRRQVPRRGDVILTREAPLGEVGMLRTEDRVFLGQRLVSYRADPEKLDNRFLLYSMQGDDMQAQIRSLGSGATVEHMRVPDAEKLKIRLPSLSIQKRIGATLAAYDELIENNTRRIAILEEMACGLYRELFPRLWFFDEKERRQVRSEGPFVALGNVVRLNVSNVGPKSAPDVIEYVDIASVGIGHINASQTLAFQEAPGRARRRVHHGDTIWSNVRPNRRSYAFICDPPANLIVSTGFTVISPIKVPASFVYFAVSSEEFTGYLTNRARGAAYPAVGSADFAEAHLLLPSAEILARFDTFAMPKLRIMTLLQRQNVNLRATRDLLLPKLISGAIDVSRLPDPDV